MELGGGDELAHPMCEPPRDQFRQNVLSGCKTLKHMIEFSRQICDRDTRLLGFGIGLKLVLSRKKVKDMVFEGSIRRGHLRAS